MTLGWTLGLLVAAPEILPTLEYARTGTRMSARASGSEERAPVGLVALPQVVLPRIYGGEESGTLPIFVPKHQTNFQESAVGAFVGMLATLFLAPIAFSNRRFRGINGFCLLLAVVGLAWTLDLPGFVAILRLPGLNMMSHNRWVFATGFALLTMAAIGMETVAAPELRWRIWFWLPLLGLLGVAAWAAFRISFPPEVFERLAAGVREGESFLWVRTLADVAEVKEWFAASYAVSLVLSAVGIGAWSLLYSERLGGRWPQVLLAVALLGELIWFGYGRSAQCAPALYYPPIPAITALAKASPGRVIGCKCLPPKLAEMCGLQDLRGYDAVDPARLMDLMDLARGETAEKISYAQTQWYSPKFTVLPSGGVQIHPVLDMLGVRYVIFRGTPSAELAKTAIHSPEYFVLENHRALPRAFVPGRVELAADPKERLARLGAADFNPREVAFVETPVSLPGAIRGTAEIVAETPTHITVSARMETPGLLVLADSWNSGWNAAVNGHPAPILCANHAIRGVVLPAGVNNVEFRYFPVSLKWGLYLAGIAAAVIAGWCFAIRRWASPFNPDAFFSKKITFGIP